MKLLALVLVAVFSSTTMATNILRAHTPNQACNRLSELEVALGGQPFPNQAETAGTHVFAFEEQGTRAAVQYLCREGLIVESSQFYLASTIQVAASLFEQKAGLLEATFGAPCHDHRRLSAGELQRAMAQGIDVRGLSQVDWRLPAAYGPNLFVSISLEPPESNQQWLVYLAAGPGGVEVKHADGRIERLPPGPCS